MTPAQPDRLDRIEAILQSTAELTQRNAQAIAAGLLRDRPSRFGLLEYTRQDGLFIIASKSKKGEGVRIHL